MPRLRPSFLATVAGLGASMTLAGCQTPCSDRSVASSSCFWEGRQCHEADGCGLNGYRCENGKWHELMTYCNPPPPSPTVTLDDPVPDRPSTGASAPSASARVPPR